jgi:radical SAM protein with 4Fe4S-binding SPASM domain
MKPLEKIYLEITNECNLACPFCPPHTREAAFMSREDFTTILAKIRGKSKFLYFHVKGEPLLHPDLGEFTDLAGESGFAVNLTTNGSLLASRANELYGKVHLARLNVSLQSLASIPKERRADELASTLAAADEIRKANLATNPDFLVSYRIWTLDDEEITRMVLSAIASFYRVEETALRATLAKKNGAVITRGAALHTAETFDWPDTKGADYGTAGFCRGLRDQAGILVDGTVVPCCLDGNGEINLGNILREGWDEIMQSQRARDLFQGFSDRHAIEPLCQHCGYRTRFSR